MNSRTPLARKVYFEVTNTCNFRCDFCPIHVSARKPQFMDYEILGSGVDQVAEDRIADTVGFHVLGEPLLYPRILDAVSHAHGRGLNTVLTTNGALLTPEMVRSLCRAGLGEMMISLQMLGPEAHQGRGTALPFEEYYSRVVEAVAQMGRKGERTRVQIVTMSTWSRRFFDVDRPMHIGANAHGFADRLTDLFQDIYQAVGRPVPRTEIQRAVRRLNPLRPWYLRVDERISVSILPFVDWGNAFTARKVFPARFGYCSYLLSNIGVLSNGEVTICCGDYDGKASLGNLGDSSLASLLRSEPARTLARGQERMRLVHPHCQRCFGSTHPAKAAFKGLASVCLFKLAGFRPGAKQKERRLLRPGCPQAVGVPSQASAHL